MSKSEKDVGRVGRGGRVDEGSPQRLVLMPFAFVVVMPLILLRNRLMAVMLPRTMLRLSEEPQPEPSACASHYTGCCCSHQLQALLGEASALGGRLFVTITFSSTLGATATLTVNVLYWAQCCNEQQPHP